MMFVLIGVSARRSRVSPPVAPLIWPLREHAPAAAQHILVVFGRFAFPILNVVIDRVGLGPKDAQRVDGNVFPEIDENPLRIKRVVFAGVERVKIGVAFPEAFRVAV